MKKSDIKEVVNNSAEQRRLCRIKYDYDNNVQFGFPLLSNEKLFLCANENDFILDGYSIRCFKDVERVESENDKYFSMLKAEKIDASIIVPTVDMTDWQTIFTSLKEKKLNVIVENEKAEENEDSFVIGKIIKATKTKVVMQHFDAEGVWEEELYEIPYSKITSVSFDTRYINVFSKYL